MKLKDWINTKLPTDEIIIGASYTPRGDAPVEHPIGAYPVAFDDSIIYNTGKINSKLCYHNINPWCYRGTRRRKKILKRMENYDEYMTKEGYSVGERISMEQYMKSMIEHKFCVSPEGNGIDCHRHYEAILTKGIPIVQFPNEVYSKDRWQTNSFMEKYEDLPVLWTRHFRKLPKEYLEEKYLEMLETDYNFDKLTLSYWIKETPVIKERISFWRNHHKLPPLEFPKYKSIEKIVAERDPDQIDSTVIIKEKPIQQINVDNVIKSSIVDVDTLVCFNSCERDLDDLEQLKKSIFYKRLEADENIGILEYFRGSKKVSYTQGNRLILSGDERYDKLHVKTYDLIKWCVSKLRFNQIIKIDANFMTYTSVGERTREKICGVDKVHKLIFKRRLQTYDGTSGRTFYIKDFRDWTETKKIKIGIPLPEWMQEEPWYYCGKAYKLSYDFAKFVATSEICKEIVEQHDIQNNKGIHPLGVEDVMIGRMYTRYLDMVENNVSYSDRG